MSGRSGQTLWDGAYLLHFFVEDPVANLIGAGAEEDLLNDLDVEALVPLEGIKPLTSYPALVHDECELAIGLEFSGVQVQIDEEGC